MKRVKLHDKEFELSISAKEIDKEIEKIARVMNEDLKNDSPLFISVLNGSFMFTSDLLKHIEIDGVEVSFIKIASYSGTSSTGEVKDIIGLKENIEGRTVVILEDMIDSGGSILHLQRILTEKNPKEIKVAAMFYKPKALLHEVKIDYYCIPLENDFVVGRGLDYDGLGRNLPDLYTLYKR